MNETEIDRKIQSAITGFTGIAFYMVLVIMIDFYTSVYLYDIPPTVDHRVSFMVKSVIVLGMWTLTYESMRVASQPEQGD